MAARNQRANGEDEADDERELSSLPRRDSGIRASADRDSRTQLTSDRPTLPPPSAADDIVVTHIHLRPTVDEILYRLSVGDEKGAFLAGLELEPLIPKVVAPRAVIRAMRLAYLEDYVLSLVDAVASWGDIIDGSPFSASESLGALCELVDKGVVTIA